jgi:hypothetical protein
VTGAARVRLVTNPGSPPELLRHRFGQVAEIGEFAGHVPEQVLRRRVHTGLTAPEVAVLARVNAAVSEAGQGKQEAYRLRDDIVTRGFAARTDRGPKIALPVTSREQVAEWRRSDLVDVSDAGVQIVDDLAELRFEPNRDEAHQDASPTEVAEAAAAAVMTLAAAPQRGQSLVSRLARPQPRRTPKLRWPPSGRSS